MKKILIATLVVAACAAVVETVAAAPVDDAIKEVLGKLDRCFAANDAPCIGELFVEDATYVAPQGDGKVIKGRAQILKVFAPAMDALNKQGGKLTHALENARMIDDSHALVDVTITVRGPNGKAIEEEGAYRGVGVMALKGGKWLCEDLRSYVVGRKEQRASDVDASKDSAAPPENAPTPAAKSEPASPTEG